MLTVKIESEFDSALLKRSIAHLETAVRSDAKNSRYRKVLSEAYLAARRFQDATDQLEIVWRERPEPRVRYLLAFSYFRMGRLSEAEKLLEEDPTKDEPVGFARLHVLRGRIRMERGEHAEAVNDFSKAMILNPDAANPKWFMAGALVQFASGARDDCAPLFRRALSLLKDLKVKPQQEDEWHENLGRIYLALHHPVEALRHLERSSNPPNAESAMLLGFAYLLQGENQRAASYLQEAASDRNVRPRCRSYLEEIAMTPRHQLATMGVETGVGSIPLFLDHEYLGQIFGPDADEVSELIQAGIKPRGESMERTQPEVQHETRKYGRLLAPNDDVPVKKETSPGVTRDEDLNPTKLHRNPDQNPEATARTSGDKLFPQTLLEMGELETTPEMQAVDLAQSDGEDRMGTLSDDDWDIGLDEAFDIESPTSIPKTRTEEIQDTEHLEYDDTDDKEKGSK
ncbi:MAG: tetratricopeptide (TPR) repeat protein [Planctomycetota bacterium]|jgi:tetratricopeptide (TPR) repeat protein